MGDPPDGYHAALAAIIDSFRRGLGASLAEFDAAWRRVQGGEPDGAKALRAVAHRLSGTAASFGFIEIAAAAEAIEGAMMRGAPTADLAPLADIMRHALVDGRRVES